MTIRRVRKRDNGDMLKKTFLFILFALFLSGCLTYEKYSFKFDFASGKVENVYSDFRSVKRKDEKDYSIEKDWKMLKDAVSVEFWKEDEKDPFKPIKAELFQEGKGLSLLEVKQLKELKNFVSKKELLNKCVQEDEFRARFYLIRDEFVLIAQSGRIESTNGQIMEADGDLLIVWPKDQKYFEFVLTDKAYGTSLLSHFLKDKQSWSEFKETNKEKNGWFKHRKVE